MKLTKIHIFIILLLALIFCCSLGNYMTEGFSSYKEYNQQLDTTTIQENNRSKNLPIDTGLINDDLNGGQSSNQNMNYSDAYNNNGNKNKFTNSVTKGSMNAATFNQVENMSDMSNDSDGIPRSKIPKGQEDLYILKSEIVPPVCPACPRCPEVKCDEKCGDGKKCPPCPPCARCPEPKFTCKMVPNYNSTSLSGDLPMPIMADFSQFGS